MIDDANDESGPYTLEQLIAMKAVDRPMRLAEWMGLDGKLLVVGTRDSGSRHWVQYDKKHGLYRVTEKHPRGGEKYPRGLVFFGRRWYRAH